MNSFSSALWTETLKMRRSKVPLFTAVRFSFAALVGAADWPTFFSVLAQAVAVGGAILFAIITIWMFGREFSDHTVKELLALPTSRETIIAAKFTILAVWTLILTVFIFLIGLIVGSLVHIPGWSTELLRSAFGDVMGSSLLTILLLPFVALVASAGRGYLPSFGWTILTVVMSQIAAITGWGDWFPWSVPALFRGMAGPRADLLGWYSYVMVILTSLIGLAVTFHWWRTADQTR